MSDPVEYRDRAVYFPDAGALVLADLHVGRDAASDVALPLGERRDLTTRLESLLDQFAPETVVFAGDVLHSFSEIPREAPETLAALRRAVRAAGARLVVTPGNHDTMLASLWDGPSEAAYRLDDGGTVVCHGHEVPAVTADRYVVGHDHPKITIEGRDHPCYLWGSYDDAELLMLPAFTRLAGGVTVNRMRTADFQSPLVTDADALRPVVTGGTTGEVHEFPPLGEFRRLLCRGPPNGPSAPAPLPSFICKPGVDYRRRGTTDYDGGRSDSGCEPLTHNSSRMHSDHELHDRIDTLSQASADTDRLVTFTVPAGQSLGEARERIESEHAEAEYIDTDATSEPVRDALERVRRILHEYDETPENGLVVYAGVVDSELTDFVFDDLPGPVETERYELANEFDVRALEAASSPEASYGLVVVERGGGVVGRFDGERVERVESVESNVAGETNADDQTADPVEFEREEQKHDFFEAVEAAAARAFLPSETATNVSGDTDRDASEDDQRADEPTVEGILLGGTEVTVEQFQSGEHLDHRLRDRIVGGTFSVEYASEQGLRQLAEKGEEHLLDPDEREARDALDRFFDAMGDESDAATDTATDADTGATDGEMETGTEPPEPVVYGRDEVDRAIEFEAVDTLLVADTFPTDELGEYEERVSDIGGDVVVVPTDIERGEQFERAFDGIGAVLRFPIE